MMFPQLALLRNLQNITWNCQDITLNANQKGHE